MTKRERLIEYINDCNVDERIAIHNAYCTEYNCMDDCIYSMDELEEVLSGVDKWDLVNMIRFGNFDFLKEFWGLDGYGNLVSYSAWELPIFASDIAGYILSKEDSLGNDEIKNILHGEMEDEDNE